MPTLVAASEDDEDDDDDDGDDDDDDGDDDEDDDEEDDGDDDGSRSDEGGEGEDKKCMVCGDHNSVEGNELIYCDGKDGECRHACHVLCCNPALKAPPARHVKWYCAPCDKRDVAAMWGAPQILDSNDCGYCHSCTGQSTVCHRKVGQLRLLYERHVVL